MLVKAHGRIILGIDHQREDGRIGACAALRGVHDERAPESVASKPVIDSQSADQTGGQQGVAGQTLGFRGAQFCQRQAGGCKRIIADDDVGSIKRNEAIADPALDVLYGQLVQIAIERSRTACKRLAVMCRREGFDTKGRDQFDGTMRAL